MRLLSVNGNKRFFLGKYHKNVLAWLRRLDPDVVALQEPWVNRPAKWWKLQGYNLVGASDDVLVWSKPSMSATVMEVEDHRVAFRAGPYEVHAVHLDPYESARRRDQLDQLRQKAGNGDNPVVVLGDFNLAPRAEDGRYGDGPSTSTSTEERRAFAELIAAFGLRDATAENGAEPEFTFERMHEGQWSRGRCDLALLPADLDPDWTEAAYDHEVRLGPDAFTDHSAVVAELPEQIW